MSSHARFLVPFVALSLIGAGCGAEVAPRVAQVPAKTVPASPVSGFAVAYLQLHGGAATLYRGSETVEATQNAELDAGDRVVVTHGYPVLLYPQAGESQLSVGSDVTLIAQPGQNGLYTEADVQAGSIWTRLERLLGPSEHFSVEANGVVATVRGTAFGVTMNGTGADVQVVDHFVEVSSASSSASGASSTSVTLVSGNGLSVQAAQFAVETSAQLQGAVRPLSHGEQFAPGFQFASRSIPAVELVAPTQSTKPFQTAPSLSVSEHDRLLQIQQTPVSAPASSTQIQVQAQAHFSAPTVGATNQNRAPSEVAPTSQGPNGQ